MGWYSPFSSHPGKVPGAQALGSLGLENFFLLMGCLNPKLWTCLKITPLLSINIGIEKKKNVHLV